MSLEHWNTFWQVGSLWLILLTFIFAGGALITGNKISAKKDAESRRMDLDISEQKERTANAETAQARVEIELAQQKERTANAEMELLEIATRIKPRRFTVEQKEGLTGALFKIPDKGNRTQFTRTLEGH